MNTVAVAMSAGSLTWVTLFVVRYFALVQEGKVTKKVTGFVLQMVAGIGLAATAVAWAFRDGAPGAAVLAPAVLAAMLASTILWLITQRKTPVGDLMSGENRSRGPSARRASVAASRAGATPSMVAPSADGPAPR